MPRLCPPTSTRTPQPTAEGLSTSSSVKAAEGCRPLVQTFVQALPAQSDSCVSDSLPQVSRLRGGDCYLQSISILTADRLKGNPARQQGWRRETSTETGNNRDNIIGNSYFSAHARMLSVLQGPALNRPFLPCHSSQQQRWALLLSWCSFLKVPTGKKRTGTCGHVPKKDAERGQSCLFVVELQQGKERNIFQAKEP